MKRLNQWILFKYFQYLLLDQKYVEIFFKLHYLSFKLITFCSLKIFYPRSLKKGKFWINNRIGNWTIASRVWCNIYTNFYWIKCTQILIFRELKQKKTLCINVTVLFLNTDAWQTCNKLKYIKRSYLVTVSTTLILVPILLLNKPFHKISKYINRWNCN